MITLYILIQIGMIETILTNSKVAYFIEMLFIEFFHFDISH